MRWWLKAAQFPLNDATYSHITLNSYKYGYLTQYSYEAARSVEPWEFGAELAMDAGIALGRNLGNIALTADGSSKPQGLEDSIQDNSSMQIANPVKAESATSGAEIFDTNWNYADYVPIAAALPQPYDRMMPRCLVKKSVWARSIAIITTTGAEAGVERLFDRLAPFSLNEDVEDASSEHQIPFILLAENAMGLQPGWSDADGLLERVRVPERPAVLPDRASLRCEHSGPERGEGLQACLRLVETSYGHRQTPNCTLICVTSPTAAVWLEITPPLIVLEPAPDASRSGSHPGRVRPAGRGG